MESDLSHEAIGELLGAFALDAVDPIEASIITAHLVDCPRCRDEVAQHQQTAAMLANTGGEAPDTLWDGISSQIDKPASTQHAFPLLRPAAWERPNGSRRHRVGVRSG